jgi:D-glycero-alpha-D-manno-heptose 1-phosphate guanylyltransferase
MSETALILAGGFGTRLRQVIKDVPKPMAPINGLPFLHFQLLYLKRQGITRVVFLTGYLASKISAYFGNDFNGLKITYSHEDTPLGTGGAIKKAMGHVTENSCFVLNGDSFFDVDLADLADRHTKLHFSASLALRTVENAGRYGQVTTDNNHRITGFHEKSDVEVPGLINGGVYMINKNKFIETTSSLDVFSIEKDFFERSCEDIPMGGFVYNGYFIDIGVPADYEKAQHDFTGFKYQ